jgi:hypothetical protein
VGYRCEIHVAPTIFLFSGSSGYTVPQSNELTRRPPEIAQHIR